MSSITELTHEEREKSEIKQAGEQALSALPEDASDEARARCISDAQKTAKAQISTNNNINSQKALKVLEADPKYQAASTHADELSAIDDFLHQTCTTDPELAASMLSRLQS